jgi:hypothetical protein
MSFELSIWLKDEELLKKIYSRFTNQIDAPKPKELLIGIREIILGKKPKKLKAGDIVHWFVKNDNKK